MIASVPSATLMGIEGQAVSVEVHVAAGLPTFNIVGLPDAPCRESRDRVRAAFLSSGLAWPLRRVTVNLAPLSVRKGGAGLDLPIAIGLLVAMGDLDQALIEGWGFLGELGLDGSLRGVPGMVSLVGCLATSTVVVPTTSAAEARVLDRHQVRAAPSLSTLLACLRNEEPWVDPPPLPPSPGPPIPDLADIRGQEVGRVAMEVSAAGGHHVLLCGPPGSGKTMLARRLPGLLPTLEADHALEVTKIHSAAGVGLAGDGLIRQPPFRAPHHGASFVSMIGGGTACMRPGEVSMAHRGVLFLDEMAEFAGTVLDSLRQPLEEGVVLVSRARASVSFPARFLLVAATNPCPCGEAGGEGWCKCSVAARARYRRRLSGPLLDRFDLRVMVARPDVASLLGGRPGEATATVAERVAAARQLAHERGVRVNAELPATRLDEVAPLERSASSLLEHKLRTGTLSARGLHRVRRVARTLADLAGGGLHVSEEQVCLALALRADDLCREEAA